MKAKCPAAFPKAYNRGGHCCASNLEKADGVQMCDGNPIGYFSSCCLGGLGEAGGGTNTGCPGAECSERRRAVAKKMVLVLFVYFYSTWLP